MKMRCKRTKSNTFVDVQNFRQFLIIYMKRFPHANHVRTSFAIVFLHIFPSSHKKGTLFAKTSALERLIMLLRIYFARFAAPVISIMLINRKKATHCNRIRSHFLLRFAARVENVLRRSKVNNCPRFCLLFRFFINLCNSPREGKKFRLGCAFLFRDLLLESREKRSINLKLMNG